MGKTRTPRLILTLFSNTGQHKIEWRVRKSGQLVGYGQPTYENIQKYVDVWERSFLPNGCNHHASFGKIVKVSAAKVHNQFTGAVLADVIFTREG